METALETLGFDLGGSAGRGAPVNLKSGQLTAERHKIPHPEAEEPDAPPPPITPDMVIGELREVIAHFNWTRPVGISFPGVVQNGVIRTAANLTPEWVGINAEVLFREATGLPCVVDNDADDAGMAEMTFGVGKDHKSRKGTVIILTIGTGIGSGLFRRGTLVPNTEYGHLKMGVEIKGKIRIVEAEHWASARAKEVEKLGMTKWAGRVEEYLRYLESLLWPDLFIIGGGISRKHDRFLPLLHTRADIVPAKLLNNAGIVGAAMAAAHLHRD